MTTFGAGDSATESMIAAQTQTGGVGRKDGVWMRKRGLVFKDLLVKRAGRQIDAIARNIVVFLSHITVPMSCISQLRLLVYTP